MTSQNTLSVLAIASIAEQAPDGILITTLELDAQGPEIVYANPATTRITGYPVYELIGNTPCLFQGPETDRAVLDRLRRQLRQGKNFSGELINYRKDGTKFIVELRITLLRDRDNAPIHWIAFQRDVTENRRAEEMATRFGRILEDSLHEIYLFDAESLRFIQVNRGARENLGYSIEELRYLTPLDVKPAFTSASFAELIAPLRKGDKDKIKFITVHRRKNGTTYPVEVHLQLSKLQTSQVFVANILDISERNRTEAAIQRQSAFVRLLQKIAVAANEASTVEKAMQICLDEVCIHTSWPVGHAFILAEDARQELVSMQLWHLDYPERFETFRRVSEGIHCPPGVCLPGRVLSDGKAIWVIDVTQDDNFPRAKLAENIGVKASFAFPVLIESKVVAVLEFFSPQTVEPDAPLLQVMANIGTQLGRVIERKQAEQALFQEKERAQVTLHSIGDAVIATDAKGLVEYLNPVAETLTGWNVDEAYGRPLEAVFHIVDEQGCECAVEQRDQCLQEGCIVGAPYHSVLFSRHGEKYDIQHTLAPIRSQQDEVLGTVLVFRDVSEMQRMVRQIAHQASHDALTGLVNRRAFEERLQRVLETARTKNNKHVLCFLDLDRFKIINDSCGHAAGDQLLFQLAGLLQAKVRSRDTVARLGGDEFGILIEHCHLKQARRVAEAIRKTVEKFRFLWEGKHFSVGVSIGLVAITETNESIAAVLQAADNACYTAKKKGRNCIHVSCEDDVKGDTPS